MNDLVARLRLEANGSQLVAEAGRSKKAVEDLGAAGTTAEQGLNRAATADRNLTRDAGAAATANDRLGRELDGVGKSAPAAARGLDQAGREARQMETSSRAASGAGAALGVVLGGLGAREIIGGIKDAAFQVQGLQTGLGAVAGGASGARSEMAFVTGEADRLGLNAKTSAESLLSLSAATNGTALQGEKTHQIWLGLNEAGMAMNLTNERQVLAMQALSQMASKQVISQEELRGQLAEALPGAYQVAQRAMGLTGQEFNKLVASGTLLADDFLPKFAAQLRKEFGPAVDQALTSPLGRARVEIAETKNSLFSLEASAGAAFLGGVTAGLADLNDELKDPQAREAAAELGRQLGELVGDGARAIGVLVDHIDEVKLGLTALTAIGVSRWLMTMTADLRGSAAAFIAKGQAAAIASAEIQAGAGAEIRAVTTLRGAVEAGARAELQAALAAREAAIAREALAAATLAQSRAQLGANVSTITSTQLQTAAALADKELAAARVATAAASARAETAAVGLARASTLMGGAMGVAKGAGAALLGLLGGPWGIALTAAAGAVALIAHELGENEKRAREAQDAQKSYAQAMSDASDILKEAGFNTRAFGDDTKGAVSPTDDLTTSTRLLTDQTLKLADARRQAALGALQESDRKLVAERDRIQRLPSRATVDVVVGDRADGSPLMGKMLQSARLDQIANERAALQAQSIGLIIAPPSETPKAKAATVTTKTKTDRQELSAQIKASDLQAAIVAQEQYRQALLAGGAAMDDWKVHEAGRQAVERLALADRPKLNAAEQALVVTIRQRAEDTARLKLADERMEAAIGLRKAMDADTAALTRRAAATALGEQALEDLQVTEAGLQALQRLGVDSLDQLTGAALDEAKAAIASAQARERQAIATDKADKVAQSLRSMSERIADEQAHTAALDGGTKAQVDYARAEFVRQELERAGKTLTAEQIAQIRDKAEALFAVQAATAASTEEADAREELRLSQLTNRERELEVRLKDRARLLQAQKKELTEQEATAQARLLTLQAMEAEQRAREIGTLTEDLKRTWIQSGKLGLDEVGDYAEQKLREALYNAWLAEPISIVVNAVVGSISGLTSQSLGIGGGGAGGVGGNLASLFTSSGALKGLTSGATDIASGLLQKIGVGGLDALKYGGMAGTAIGGAGTGMLVSSLAGMLGLKQTKGNQIGGTIGGAIGSFIPIPGGTLIGSVLGNLVGGLVGGKKSNEAAVVSLDQTGQVTSIGGAKRNDATTAAANSIATAVAQIQAALVAGGATLGATVSKIDIGQRDPTHLNFSNGVSIDTAVGDTAAAIEAATKTILDNAKWATEAQTAYAQKMLAAGATLDQVVATLQGAATFSGSIDDAIAKLTDPAAFEKKAALDAIEANYSALKAQAQQLIDAGLTTGDVLAKIDHLKDLQVDEALKRLGDAANSAAAALDPAAFAKSISDGIASLSDPTGFARAQALADINASIAAMREQAVGLVASGELTADVFAQLDQLKDLKVADSIKKLGDAATDAAKALADSAAQQKAAGSFSGSIDDLMLKFTDPAAYARKSAIDQINQAYDDRVAQATPLIAAGALSAEILDKLATVRDLEIGDALSQLAGSAQEATDVFAEARPRLQAWLDGLALGANSSLNPGQQKQSAMSAYERTLALARSGDADALSQITSSADQLLGADRNATSSATDRLALSNRVQADIQGLIGMSGSAVGANPQVVQLTKVATAMEKLTTFLDPELVAKRPPAPMEVKLSPWLQEMQRVQITDQTTALKGLLEKLTEETKAARDDTVKGLSKVEAGVATGLATVASALEVGVGGLAGSVAALAQNVEQASRDAKLTNTYMRQVVKG